MANKAVDSGRAFLAKVLERIPPEARVEVQKHLEVDGVLTELGVGVLARADHSRAMAAVQEDRGRLNKWYEENLPLLEAGKRAMLARERQPDLDDDQPPPDRQPAVDTAKFVSREEAAQVLQQFEKNSLTYWNMLQRISNQHRREFGDDVDPDTVVAHSEQTGLRLDLAWEDLVRDRREKARQEKFEADLKKAREEGMLEGRSQAMSSQLPFISGNPEITTLDGLRTGDDKPQTGLAAALRTFHEETAKAAAAGK